MTPNEDRGYRKGRDLQRLTLPQIRCREDGYFLLHDESAARLRTRTTHRGQSRVRGLEKVRVRLFPGKKLLSDPDVVENLEGLHDFLSAEKRTKNILDCLSAALPGTFPSPGTGTGENKCPYTPGQTLVNKKNKGVKIEGVLVMFTRTWTQGTPLPQFPVRDEDAQSGTMARQSSRLILVIGEMLKGVGTIDDIILPMN